MRSRIVAGLLPVLVCLCAGAQVPRTPPAAPLLIAEGAEIPIVLDDASIGVEAVGSIARTTVELVFRNPNARQLEGRLQFPLLPGQQVDGFALDIDGRMRDAVAVPKDTARQVFEAVERREVDPALLENTEGNHFRLRLYPIPPQGTRRVRLVFLEALRPDGHERRLRLPLQFAAQARQLRLAVRGDAAPRIDGASAGIRLRRGKDGAVATLDPRMIGRGDALELRWPLAPDAPAMVESFQGQRYFHAEIPVHPARRPRALPASVGLLWDASASGRHRDHAAEFALLDRYFRQAGDIRVKLWRLRDRAGPAVGFDVRAGDWRALRAALEEVVYDGATDPGAWTPDAGVGEYLLFSDGLFNYGERRFPALRDGQRLYAVNAAGAAADGDGLAALAEAHGGRAVALDGGSGIGQAADALLNGLPRVLALQADGADSLVHAFDAGGDFLRVAGRFGRPGAQVRATVDAGDGQPRAIRFDVPAQAPTGPAARLWAGLRLRALQADEAANADAIAKLGMRFGLVTPGSSLLVLDEVEDYLRYGIAPPSELRAEYDRLQAVQVRDEAAARRERLDAVADAWAERAAWWEHPWPKAGRPRIESTDDADAGLPQPAAAPPPAAPQAGQEAVVFEAPVPVDAPSPGEAPQADVALERARSSLDSVVITGARAGADAREATASIRLQPWQPDSPFARRLRAAPKARIYAEYLREREAHADSTAFYLDVADILFEAGQPDLALRVLSNLAELDLENRHVLRVLGYRLMQADRADLALPLFRRVARLAPDEPQSFRDLGLAHAALGARQEAIDALYKVVEGDWDDRFEGVAEIALAELNAEVARAKGGADVSRIDPRLLRNLPVGLRTVLTWDSDDTDMDLWVTDPDGEKCFYQHTLTHQGGRISNDFTGGYGPEEFVLRAPRPGKYRVEVNLYGDHRQLVAGATTLQLWLSTGFGTPGQHDRKVIVRLEAQSDTVLVGEFDVE